MRAPLLIVPMALLTAQAAPSQPNLPGKSLSPPEIVAAAPAGDWVDIAPADLLVMDLAPDAAGKPRRVVIQLMPAPFSQGWVGNIRKLAAAHWWDGTSINRVQDNYVVQWGDANGEDKAKAKPLPPGLATVPQSDYLTLPSAWSITTTVAGAIDSYAPITTFYRGWPIAAPGVAWPVHCYATVGVGRNLPPDTGSGAELYAVIGHAPRHLDRNIAVVGRVVQGIEHLSTLPRGTAALGFYDSAEQRVPIVSIRMATELAEAVRPHIQYLSTESASFARYAGARANRRDAFFVAPAGGADICNIPVPIRIRP